MNPLVMLYHSLQNLTIEKFCQNNSLPTYKELADKYPVVNKIVIVANHALRLIPMIALMEAMPYSRAVNCSIMLAGSLFYRVTIERLCPIQFSLLSCKGAIAYTFAKSNSFKGASCIPLAAYAVSVLHAAYSYKGCCKA